MKKSDGRVWFITGVSSGLGRTLAEAVLRQGGTVIGTTRSGRVDLDSADDRLRVLALEVTDAEQVHRLRPCMAVWTWWSTTQAMVCSAPSKKRPTRKPHTCSR